MYCFVFQSKNFENPSSREVMKLGGLVFMGHPVHARNVPLEVFHVYYLRQVCYAVYFAQVDGDWRFLVVLWMIFL